MLLSRNSGCKGKAFILIDKEFAERKMDDSQQKALFFAYITFKVRVNNLSFRYVV